MSSKEISIRSSAAEYLTFIAATGENPSRVELRYEDDGGNVYTAMYPNLNTLNGSPDIVLEPQTASGN